MEVIDFHYVNSDKWTHLTLPSPNNYYVVTFTEIP